VAAAGEPPEIVVLAGTNGGGKSSIAGAALESRGGTFYDPDAATRAFLAQGLSSKEANSRAWHRGREQLDRAIREGLSYAFETTLGGRTMTRLLLHAAARAHAVRIWYVGLTSPELHIQRVQERVALGGHDIPEAKIRERWDASRKNLIRLLPHTTELVVYDNSRPVDIRRGEAPRPVKLLHIRDGAIRYGAPAHDVPEWAKPIVVAAMRTYPSG
jgi:predicted ABC-type ATPase